MKQIAAALLGVAVTLFVLWPDVPQADTTVQAPMFQKRGALIVSRKPANRLETAATGPSLFAGQAAGSLFERVAVTTNARSDSATRPVGLAGSANRSILDASPSGGGDVHRIRQLIGHAESRRDGYDAVVFSARIKPPKRPTAMTIGEIYDWIDATPRQNHAIGRYQFIPVTLRRLVRQAGLTERHAFSPAVQDLLADILLAEAGLHSVRKGEIGRHRFMNNLSRIWAGLPNSTGKSHYHGHAGNKSTISWSQFDAEMSRLFPGRG